MAPKNTRKGDTKASKDIEELHSKEETEIEAIAMEEAEADTDEETSEENATKNATSDRNSKRRRVLTQEASGDLLASATVVTATAKTSAGDNSAAHMYSETSVSAIETVGSSKSITLISVDSSISRLGDAPVAAAATYKSVISGMVRANKSNSITEENYYLLQWLYRIRRVSCARGLRIGFFRPDFLWSIYRHMMRSKKLWRTDGDIQVAVNLWCSDRAAALKRYGHISDWDVSSVTNMSGLFENKVTFNDDISRWDISEVTDMGHMFYLARSFNQPIGKWDVSKVTNLWFAFYQACAFDQPIGN
jgi:hypothetical protein